MISKPTLALLGLLATVVLLPAHAARTDKDQPITIEADWAEADDLRRITVYKGKVIVVQGTIRITGDVVTMYYSPTRELSKLVATGRPARFRQKQDEGNEYQRAKGSRIEYLVSTNTMILINNAELAQGTSKVSADRIVYDTARSRIKAESKPTAAAKGSGKGKPRKSKGRVRILIEPTKQ
ncbi:MAG: lipopolysaccharide transport periplasmic protein LptA [Pseudomonadota bacterium]